MTAAVASCLSSAGRQGRWGVRLIRADDADREPVIVTISRSADTGQQLMRGTRIDNPLDQALTGLLRGTLRRSDPPGACLQLMTWSKVNSGFWLSLPSRLVASLQEQWGVPRFRPAGWHAWKMPAVQLTVVSGALEDKFVEDQDPLVRRHPAFACPASVSALRLRRAVRQPCAGPFQPCRAVRDAFPRMGGVHAPVRCRHGEHRHRQGSHIASPAG